MSHVRSDSLLDGFDLTRAPPEFQEWETTIWLCNIYTIVTWLYVYLSMIHRSIKHRTFGMPLCSQCLDIAWEIVFGILFAADSWIFFVSFLFTIITNLTVTWAAIKYGSPEWDRSPMIKHNLVLIYTAGIAVSILGHVAGVQELGAIAALFANAIVCQAVLSLGCLGQLLTRGSTRGFGSDLWSVPLLLEGRCTRLMVPGSSGLQVVSRWSLSSISASSTGPRGLGSLEDHLCCGVARCT